MANYLEWQQVNLPNKMTKKQTLLLLFLLLSSASSLTMAQDDLSQHWNGIWTAEGTLFSINVEVENNAMKVGQIESLGFEWTSKNGTIEGNIVTMEVEYAGATGLIQAELLDANTAVAFAATCVPDFMVACLLSKDRQAIFRKVAD